MAPIRVAAPAKINLFLHITGKRPDGYHNLLSLMCPIGLYDTLVFTPAAGGKVTCDHPDVPQDESNMAARSVRLFMETVFANSGGTRSEFSIQIEKRIPVGAGLGGGSSDAAAVLTFLNDHYGQPLSRPALMALGARIGADVPFFIFGAPALASGIGDRLEPVAGLTPQCALLVYPNRVVSTAWVYKNLNLRLTKDEKELRKLHFNGRYFNAAEHLVNDLEPVTAKAFPVITQIKRWLLANGADGAMMAGSGSTVFGLYANHERATMARSALCNHRQGHDWSVFVADLLI